MICYTESLQELAQTPPTTELDSGLKNITDIVESKPECTKNRVVLYLFLSLLAVLFLGICVYVFWSPFTSSNSLNSVSISNSESPPLEADSTTPSPASQVTSLPSFSPSPTVTSQIPKTQTTIKVLSIAYFPTIDGKLDTKNHIQDTYGEYNYSLSEIRTKVQDVQAGAIALLEEGSRYHGYKDTRAIPYLNYEIVREIELLEPVPLSDKKYGSLPLPAYKQMLDRIQICDYIDTQNVREVWLWTYQGTGKSLWESNFSSPVYQDISNSDKDPNDLPQCAHSYTVYDYNYGRGVSEAVEDHIHQYEALFNSVDRDLFWNKFVGYFPGGNWATANSNNQDRRCGWAHYPPNGQKDYDWNNQTAVITDCENWNPTAYSNPTEINCSRWGCTSAGYFKWWMQNIPGSNNNITYQGKKLRNWWEFVADYDSAMTKNDDFFEE